MAQREGRPLRRRRYRLTHRYHGARKSSQLRRFRLRRLSSRQAREHAAEHFASCFDCLGDRDRLAGYLGIGVEVLVGAGMALEEVEAPIREPCVPADAPMATVDLKHSASSNAASPTLSNARSEPTPPPSNYHWPLDGRARDTPARYAPGGTMDTQVFRNETVNAGREQQKRQLLAETARPLFAERGFEQVSVAEIARTADVSEPTVFNYFPTKEDLVYSGLERFEDELRRDRLVAPPAKRSAGVRPLHPPASRLPRRRGRTVSSSAARDLADDPRPPSSRAADPRPLHRLTRQPDRRRIPRARRRPPPRRRSSRAHRRPPRPHRTRPPTHPRRRPRPPPPRPHHQDPPARRRSPSSNTDSATTG